MPKTQAPGSPFDAKGLLTALKAIKKGDFSIRLSTDEPGLHGAIAEAFNDVADLLESSSREFARVGTVVGKEGKINQRASLGAVTGSWATKAEALNTLIGDLVQPTSEVARVIGAVAKGDLSQRIALEHDGTPLKGEFLRIGKTVNTMVDQLGSFASEVTRVAREVGTEGRLGGQAEVKGVAGTWKDLTDSVNSMAGNLTDQVRNIAEVTTAVAKGDLSKKITVDVKGEILELKNTINTMVDQLGSFASEVTRVAREVGTEGRLGGQAEVRGVGGTWKDLTDSVNSMAGNLTSQVRNIAQVTTAVANGDLSKKITVDVKGEILELKNTINTMVDQLSSFASEVTRVAREVGTEGRLGGQAEVRGVGGTWKDLTDSVNSMAGNLTSQVRNIAQVTTAVANGDLSKKITVDVKGEILELKNTINTMVDQLGSFASEVTRVAREVGTDGRLGGQADVRGVAGTWKDLTDSVNFMAGNLTAQVRNIADVTTAVANGNLSKKITVDVKGEILELKNTINTMVDQLGSFASEVTRVAREVGTEGRLGGQADVRGVAGTWKDLTDSVNFMAGNLTAQVRNIAEVTTAVATGDLSKKITVDVKGEILELKNTINTMVDQLNSFASEVTRVAREVGTEGQLGGQAEVKGVAGTWKDLTDSVNSMAGNLTAQVRNIADVTTAVANGDLSKKITVTVRGEILELKDTINTMVDQLNSFASEVTRVAREVGTEGRLGGQADVKGVAGTWKDLTDSVNSMAGNVTAQVRNIAEVTTAVANGDLRKKVTVDVRGEILELKNTINAMVDQLNSFASEVTRVAREVGTEGRLGGQAEVKGVAGVWKDLTDNVNSMASNLTAQVRNIAEVTTAVANGDLRKKVTVDVRGEILELKNTINAMVDQLNSFASEVTRVALEVGSEGKLGGQALVRGVAGVWKDLTDSVNSMAGNLTAQVRNIAEVTTAVANGDLRKKVTVDVRGEILQLKNTINAMVDQLNSFASEVTRVALEVGTEGMLGGQARVPGVAGVWKDLTDSVNSMGSNLTAQVRNIAEVTTAVANGNLTKKVDVNVRGEILELKNTINAMVDQLNSFASEVTRVAREVGTEGQLGGKAQVRGVAGVWKDLTDNVNWMADNLTAQVRNIAEVTTAVANGDLRKQVTVDVKGEILQLKKTINAMVDQLNSFASEVTRVALEVGTEGKLGGQAQVRGVAGVWKDLTDSVNSMAGNLTSQVRGIAKVVTAVANGDLKRKLIVEAKGEIAELADTINEMIETLATFADQVITVAREVGVQGQLGGQAKVPGAAGTWKDLTDNVNQLAANLTTQIRLIAEVANAVTQGDLTRSITVEAKGEVAALKDIINEMIRNLKDTTQKNTEQDWLKTNLAKFTRMLQGQRDLMSVTKMILSELAPVVSAQHGVFYMAAEDKESGAPLLRLTSTYAFRERRGLNNHFKVGEGLVGQCAFEKERILVNDVPSDYIRVSSGLGETKPLSIVVLPVLFEGKVKGVIELASLNAFKEVHLTLLDQLSETFAIVLNTIEANMRTEGLLAQSRTLAAELTEQQKELQETNQRLEKQAASLKASEELLKKQQDDLKGANEELESKARQLFSQKTELEGKNREIELARLAVQERAEQLAITSKYKSEFLTNMSHELRTPLNSLLILAEMLVENNQANLTPKQLEFAKTIYSSGSDLLSLINDILDMAKIESGTMTIEAGDVVFADLRDYVDRTFRPVAESKGLQFSIRLADNLPRAFYTDPKRLEQVLRNLLSNAFKFTERGEVDLDMQVAREGWTRDHPVLSRSKTVVAFSIKDTGIGIPPEKHKVIFEPFQQADMGTGRKYGGTGLGLSISREIVRLLGGEIRVQSKVDEGSTFTLFLPQAPPLEPKQAMPLIFEEPPSISPPEAGGRYRGGRFDGVTSARKERQNLQAELGGDRDFIQPGDRVVLIVEHNPEFADILLGMAHDKGFKGLILSHGEPVLALARQLKPDAITLDIKLPDTDGWAVLDRLKHDPNTRHIPVHVISVDENTSRGMRLGAFACLKKPVAKADLDEAFAQIKNFLERRIKNLLVVEDNSIERDNVVGLIGNGDVRTIAVSTAEEAIHALRTQSFDCLVLDLMLPDMSGLDLLDKVRKELHLEDLPVVVYTAKDLSREEQMRLWASAQSVITKDPNAMKQLLEKTAMFLHRVEANWSPSARKILEGTRDDAELAGKKVLIVDDDLRNLFALISVLERWKMQVFRAESGEQALEILKQTPDMDLVLMDIMMPDMDGYETIQAIRRQEAFGKLPIIAVTAKAMKSDRQKCLLAGASDYVAKPVPAEELLARLRAWLFRKEQPTHELQERP
jgi:HAMP domain-containing protein/signal transduction histidine kinase/CheY-like chemotaxis protein